jgi:hypothetical protein
MIWRRNAMKAFAGTLVFGAIVSLAAVVGPGAPSNAEDSARVSSGAAMETPATDFSARKKRRYYGAFPVAVAPPTYYGARANPNYGPGTAQMRQARQQNRCVMDEGYGRWTACSNQ